MCRIKKVFCFILFYSRMGILPLAIVNLIVLLSASISVTALQELGYSVEKYDKSPGIYYENKGIAVLYNVAWKTIVYVNLDKIDNETLMLKQYVHHVEILCQTTLIRNWTGCAHFGSDTRYGWISWRLKRKAC
jgi:hypothetical protein